RFPLGACKIESPYTEPVGRGLALGETWMQEENEEGGDPAVHSSRFSLPGSCSCSVRGSRLEPNLNRNGEVRSRKREQPLLVFPADHQRPDLREVHLRDRDRLQVRLREEARQIEIGLEADVHGEGRDGALEARENRARAAEVIQDDNLSARL